MKVNAYNAMVARDALQAIARFEEQSLALEDIHAVIQSCASRLENDGSHIDTAMRLAEADLEEIRFTTLGDEQHPRALARLAKLRAAIDAALDARSGGAT